MKKHLLFLSLALAAGCSAASAEGILTTPQGTLYENVYRYNMQYLTFYGQLNIQQIEGKIGKIVIDGDNFYMLRPVNTFSVSQDYWIKGTRGADGKIVFKFPQDAYVQPGNQYLGTEDTQLYNKMFKIEKQTNADGEVTGYEFVEDTDNPDLVMKWENGVLSQVVPEGYESAPVVGLTDGEIYSGSSDGDFRWSLFDETLQTPPEGLETKQYVVKSENSYGQISQKIVHIGIKDGEMWIRDLYSYFPDSWVKGKVEGDKVTLSTNQYLGIYTTEQYYYFFQTAEVSQEPSDYGEMQNVYTPLPEATLTLKDGAYTVEADCALMMCFGKNTANPGMPSGSVIENAVFTPYVEVAATPAAPYGIEIGDDYGWGRNISFKVPCTDTEGNFIDPNKLYYNIYVNGELFSLTPEEYPSLKETITDIPYLFNETGVIFTNGGEDHTLTLNMEEKPEIGIQSVYTGGGETRKSDLVLGIGSISAADATVETTEYYTISGLRVAEPVNGLYIRVDNMSDGSVKTSKVIVR